MNLRVEAEETPHASSRTASLRRTLKSGALSVKAASPLIHSAPTGESAKRDVQLHIAEF